MTARRSFSFLLRSLITRQSFIGGRVGGQAKSLADCRNLSLNIQPPFFGGLSEYRLLAPVWGGVRGRRRTSIWFFHGFLGRLVGWLSLINLAAATLSFKWKNKARFHLTFSPISGALS